MNVRLYIWQRGTAALMAPLVLVHLATMFYATRQGLTANDILSRTHGSVVWALFYGTFVVAAAIHAAIGSRNILLEWLPMRKRFASVVTSVLGISLVGLGARAVVGVVFG